MDTETLLRQAKVKAGGKQRNLASAVAVREETVSRWFAGTNEPSPEKRRALLKFVGVNLREIERIMTREGD